MTELDEHGRPEPPIDGDEAATLLGFLDYQRATLAWKCRGVDAPGLRVTVAESTITLGGLLKHLAYYEDDWFSRTLWDNGKVAPWDTVDWAAEPDWEWSSAATDPAEDLFALWSASVDRSRSLVARALTEDGLGFVAKQIWPDGRSPSLRWIVCHMIEEYARHNGHADLIREHVDGETGE